jgi:hypothetical protein
VTPVVGLFAEVMPRIHDLVVEPQGAVGQTPRFWLGATLALAVRFR